MFKKIINTCLLACVMSFFISFGVKDGFKDAQLKSERVKKAYKNKWSGLKTLLKTKNIQTDNFDIYLRAFKHESSLEIWVKNVGASKFQLLKTISICSTSGVLGPKRKQGDEQVPEGFYDISSFNPYSSYHLSLKVNYPNKSDAIKAIADPGGDIMIHGNCVTIGCIPIENDPIEELYVLCVEGKNRQRSIRADIFPYKFNNKSSEIAIGNQQKETLAFWRDLKKGYSYFESNHLLPKILVDRKGNYQLCNN
jgi:murein L,D-transpeptidase YafK